MRGLLLVVGVVAGCGGEAAEGLDAGAPADAMTAEDTEPVVDTGADPADAAADGAVEDGGPPAPQTDFVVELGLGDRVFRPVQTGDVAPLQRGCQGAQHVWISLRSPDLDPGDLPNTLRAVRVRDGEEVVPPHTLELPWVAGGPGVELVGVTLVMFDPVAVVGEVVDLFAEVEAPDGRVGRAVIRVRVEWGPDAC